MNQGGINNISHAVNVHWGYESKNVSLTPPGVKSKEDVWVQFQNKHSLWTRKCYTECLGVLPFHRGGEKGREGAKEKEKKKWIRTDVTQ